MKRRGRKQQHHHTQEGTWAHGFIQSAMGPMLLRPWFDRFGVRFLGSYFFPLSRGWAAAEVAGLDHAVFIEETGGKRRPKRLVGRALRKAQAARRLYEDAAATWNDAFFGQNDVSAADLHAVNRRRDEAAYQHMNARRHFLPLHLAKRLPACKSAIDPVDFVHRRHGERRESLDKAFALPDEMPHVESSRKLVAPGVEQYWIRFASPDEATGGPLWARVFEPKRTSIRGSLILSHGIGTEDEFWGYSARGASHPVSRGIRMIQPEGPWHGRRRLEGYYGGEPIFARGPGGLMDYFHAHVRELGVLTRWAHGLDGMPVGLAGISLGSLTTQLAGSAAHHWPEDARPDGLFLITFTASMPAVAFESELVRRVGVSRAIEAGGWTHEHIEEWAPLLAPVRRPEAGAERVVALLGKADDVLPYETGIDLVRHWKIPDENVFVRKQGHFSVALGLTSSPEPVDRFIEVFTSERS